MDDEPSRGPAWRIPVTIVSGFLGSGKTTFINTALREPVLADTLVIVNEFGEIGLDHALIESSSDSIVVLDNGCLCCTVFGDLIGTLNGLYHRRASGALSYERIIIETSGLADPTSVVQAFLSDPTLQGLFKLASLVTLVDTVNGQSTLEEYDEAVRQVALADAILLTKTELATPDQQQEIGLTLSQINPLSPMTTRTMLPVDFARMLVWQGFDPARGAKQAARWLFATGDHKVEANEHDHHHHDHLKIATLSFVRDEPVPMMALQLLLEGVERNLGSSLLRLKAIVTVQGRERGPAIIHGAQHLLHNIEWLDRWPFEDRKSRFVLIASGLDKGSLTEMVELLDRIAHRSARATTG